MSVRPVADPAAQPLDEAHDLRFLGQWGTVPRPGGFFGGLDPSAAHGGAGRFRRKRREGRGEGKEQAGETTQEVIHGDRPAR